MQTFFARTEHGGHRVVPIQGGSAFKVNWPHGSVIYPSKRQVILALVNRTPQPPPGAYDPHLTFDRYFRRGRHGLNRRPALSVDVFDLFRPKAQIAIAKPAPKITPSPKLTVFQPERGIDLKKRAHEVRKLFFAGFARRVHRYGYDPEDVLQEIYQGLLVRNKGKCPFDPTKSSFGHYVHMVCGCIVSNYHRRYSRLARNEVFGVLTVNDAEMEMVDVADADLVRVEAVQEDQASFSSTLAVLSSRIERAAAEAGYDPKLATSCIDYLYEGRKNREIAEITGSSAAMVTKVIRLVRSVALEWREGAPLPQMT